MTSEIMGGNLGKCVALDFGIQWACFIVAALLKTERFYDLAGSATYLLLCYKSLAWGQTYFARQKVQTGMTMLWALRLGTYLFSRILKDGEDRRFRAIKTDPAKFFGAWTMQGMWILFNLLPVLIVNEKKADKPLTERDYVGWTLWTIGFLFEAIADYQKSAFRANPDNAGKFIKSGLWSISRHPNYFGEILLWCGMFVASSSVLRGWEWISVISPLFTTLLLTRVSGIPMLEKSGLKRWGTDPNYQEYLRNTAVLIPYLW